MVTRLRKPGVLPAIMLVIIVLWALLAVFLLTNTLVNAQQIDNRVEVINGEVGAIDNELDNVVLAQQTSEISGQIREAALPLSGQLTQTNESVRGIDGSAKDILGNTESINGSAKEINSTVQQINGNVDSIGSTLDSIEGNTESINGSVDGITASFGGTLAEVVSIDDGAAGINRRADVVTSQVRGIAANVGNVTDVLAPAIIANSEAIEGSPLLLQDVDAADTLMLNQLAAEAALPAQPNESDQVAPLPMPDLSELPAPAQLPEVSEAAPNLPLGPQQSPSPENDSGSVLGSVVGGL